MLVDTHAHIHFNDFQSDLAEIFDRARAKAVGVIITVGTDESDSAKAVSFVSNTSINATAAGIGLYTTVGLHPHEAGRGRPALAAVDTMLQSKNNRIVAVGECGLDYYRNRSAKSEQAAALRFQIELAQKHDLPLVFHVRDAWEDFFAIIGDYSGLRGVIHSFTGGPHEVRRALKHGFYFGLNGIMTFTKLDSQLEAARVIPDEFLLLETDCPFLAPAPRRGRRNEPAYVADVAEFLARHRRVATATLASTTTANARKLFAFEL